MSECELRQFLIDVLDGRNSIINKISKDLNHKEQFQTMVNELSLTEHSFEPKLKTIATILIPRNSKNIGCFASLLIFGIELDSFHSLNSSWYRRDMLIETLYNILLGSKLTKREEYSFWEYTIILFVCLTFLILFKKI